MNGNKLIELTGVGMRLNDRMVLHDVDFALNSGDFVVITGPNGGGKTTLLRIMLKLLRPTVGRVEYFTSDGSPAQRLSIGYLPQKNSIDSQFPITVREMVEQGLLTSGAPVTASRREDVEEMVALVELSSHIDSPIGRLSGGQMQRALFARALVSRPSVLVLDEPQSYLDKHFERKMMSIIGDVARDTTIVVVSHEVSDLSSIANRHLIVDTTVHICHSNNHLVHSCCDD